MASLNRSWQTEAITLAVALCAIPFALPAIALDWSIRSDIGETVELNDNQFLKTSPAGTIGAYTDLSANIEARTPTSRFDFDGDGRYQKYWGPGVDGMLSQFTTINLKASYEHQEKNNADREFANASFSQQNLALALLNDLGTTSNATGFINRWAASGGFDRALTGLDLLKVTLRTIYTDFDPPSAGIAFTDTLLTATWKHRASASFVFTATSEAQSINYANVLSSDLFIFRNLIGFETDLSPVVSFRGAIGGAFLQSNDVFGAPVALPIPTQLSVSSHRGEFIGNAYLSYKLLSTVTISLEAIRSLEPNIVGAITTRSTARANLDYSINSHSSLSASVDFTRLVETTSADFTSFSAIYSYQWTREWSSRLSYRFLHRSTSENVLPFDSISGLATGGALGPANSNSIMATLTRSFVVLPPGN